MSQLELFFRLAAEEGVDVRRSPIPRLRRDGDDFPLSPGQERLWFLWQLAPANPFYNTTAALLLAGDLDVATLEWALREIILRHEVLRTTFPLVRGSPRQRVAPPGSINFRLTVVDLEHLPEDTRGEAARLRAAELAGLAADLERGPLFRTLLLRLDARAHHLLINMHHIVSDAWSLGVIAREIGLLYEAGQKGAGSPLAPLPIQYAEYAVWQRHVLDGPHLRGQVAFWKRRLAGVPQLLELPSDRPRPSAQSFRGGRVPSALPEEVWRGIHDLCRREGVTMFVVLLAAFKVLLHRYTSREAIVVGVPTANRLRAEVEPLVGFFSNTLLVRTDLTPRITFLGALRRVRDAVTESYAHQEVPFERLVSELRPARDVSINPLFQVMFSFANTALPPLTMPGLEIKSLPVETNSTHFDLTMSFEGDGERPRAFVEYSADLFRPSRVERMLGHWVTLLAGVTIDPTRRIGDYSLITDLERQQLRGEWETAPESPHGTTLAHRLFEAQACRTPQATAVVCDGRDFTYRQINGWANALAHRLASEGIAAERRVGLCAGRGLAVVVGMLGILKAGGVLVPLDPSHPDDRLAALAEDARLTCVLVDDVHHPLALGGGNAAVVNLADYTRAGAEALEAPPDVVHHSEQAAYIFYTSGSTGRPKASVVSHDSLAWFTSEMSKQMELSPSDRVLQFAPLGFDVILEEIFPALASGAAVVIEAPGRLLDPTRLSEVVAQRGVTVLELPRGYWERWGKALAAAARHDLGRLRLVLVGCEPVRAADLVQWGGTGVPVVSVYGLTETTVTSTLCRLPTADADGYQELPVGRTLAGARVYLLDASLGLVPAGVSGEIYVGGRGVGRGYLGLPALTAELFIPDPFTAEPGGRMYRTGDLGCRTPGGQLRYLGRADAQVKVEGCRVEPGEVEAGLLRHPAVREAFVCARADAEGARRLVAYVVCRPGVEATGPELRRHLSARLPSYMIPPAFGFVSELPRTAAGKINRAALPEPEEAAAGRMPRAPLAGLEREIAGIWESVLVAEVGATDDFFQLGGHSIQITLILSRINDAFQSRVTVRDFFEAATVEGLARRVEERRTCAHAEADEPIAPLRRETYLVRRDRVAPSRDSDKVEATGECLNEVGRARPLTQDARGD